MKILFVVNDLGVGGITTALYNVVKECYKHEINVDVLCMNKNQRIPKKLETYCNQINIENSRLKYLSLTKKDIVESNSVVSKLLLYVIGGLKKVLTRIGIWHKCVFLFSTHLGTYDVAIAYRQGPLCAQIINHIVDAKKKIGFMHGDVRDMNGIEKWIKYYKNIDKIVCVSKAVENSFKDKFPRYINKFCSVYNMFDVISIHERANRETCEIKREGDEIVFVTASRLAEHKGTGRIPEICQRVVEQCGEKSFKWYVIGEGVQYEPLVRETQEKNLSGVLHFCGVQSNPYKYMRNGDATVLVTYTEGYPMCVIESLILNKPVITTRYSAVEEMILNNVNGCIIEENSVNSIANAIIRFVKDDEYRIKLVNGAKNYEYDAQTPWEQFEQAFL